MADGRILIVGGKDGNGNALETAEVLNADGTIAPVPSMLTQRYGHSAILLRDGNVLVAGGHTSGGGVVNSAELFDPVANAWHWASNTMADARADFTLSQLSDGTILVAGGDNGSGPISGVETFDLLTKTFKYGGHLNKARKSHAASVLKDGRVLITGGSALAPDGSTIVLNTTEIYDPSSTSLNPGPALNAARYAHSSTTLIDGTVLLAGGNNGSSDLGSLEVCDPVANSMTTSSATLSTPRSGHLALLLPNNNHVLIAGGTSASTALSSTELYRSWTSSILANPAMSAAREGAVASALQADGTAMVAGGSNLGSTELYAFATIKTDASDYPPGTNVHITGSGWVPGETVALTLVESPLIDTHGPYGAVADANGNISDNSFTTNADDVNISFALTAVGSKSQAFMTFTDSNPKTITISSPQSPNPVTSGSAATYGVAVSFTGNANPCTVTLSTSSLPGGATATFNPSSVVGSGGSAPTSVLTISTTDGVVPVGTSSFTVIGTPNSACDGGPTPLTTSTTLTVKAKATAVFSALAASSSILYGQTSITVSGHVADAANTVVASSPDTVTVTINNTPLSVPIQTTTGNFSGTFNTSSIPALSTPYTIQYSFAGDANLTSASDSSKTLTVSKVTPVLSWSAPAAITYGTALSATQLNATATYQSGGSPATVAGTFTYTPAAGTILSAGSNQTLSVHFVPTDATDFATPADKTVALSVQTASLTPTVTAFNKIYDGTTAATFTCSLSGVVGTDDVSCTGGTAAFVSAAAGTGVTVTATGLQITGAKAANYALASTTGTTTANITAKTLTISGVMAADKVYDGTLTATLNAANATLQGVVSVDVNLVILQSAARAGSFSDKNVGVGKAVSASGFTLSGASAGNYTLTQPTGLTASITAKPLTVSGITASDKIYDGTTTATLNTSSAALVGVISGETITLVTTGATGTFSDKNVGTGKTVTVAALTLTSTVGSTNYSLTQPTATASITAKTVTVSAVTAANKTYDGTLSASLNTNSAALVGVISGDAVTLGTAGSTGSFADKTVGVNKIVSVTGLSISGADSGNYSLTQPTATASITAKQVTASGVTAADKTYDGSTTAALNLASAVIQGLISGDTVTLSTSTASGTFADKNAGTSKVVTVAGLSLAGVDAGNYLLTQPTTTASISAKTITVSGITSNSKIYDGNTSATLNLGAAALQGIIPNDLVAPVTSAATGSFADKNVGTAKPVTVAGVTLSGADAQNYALTRPTTAADITPKSLTVAVTVQNKIYDGTTSAAIASQSLTGVVNQDAVSLAGGTAMFANKNAGVGKTVTVSGLILSGADAGNYSISTSATATADITPRPLTVTATGNSKVYDGNGTASVTLHDDRLAGDNLTDAYVSAMFGDKNVGQAKTITVSGISISGADLINYSLANITTTATADITARTLTVSATADDKVYDGNNSATAHLSDNRISGDTFTETYTAASFPDKTVGAGRTVSITGISISGGDAGNYILNAATATATASITARPLVVTATGVSRKYDGMTAATVTLSDNRLAGDVFTAIYTAASFADRNVGSGKTVTVTGISLTGADAGNYVANTTATTTASITPRLVTISAVTDAKIYDATVTSSAKPTLSGDGVAPGDSVSSSQTFDTKNVGTAKTLTPTGTIQDGNGGANYQLTFVVSHGGSITPRPLTVSATGVSKQYDGLTAASVTLTDDRLTGDVFTDSYTSASFANKNVGTGKTVSVTGISISGADASNYSLVNAAATASADITVRTLTVSATGASKTYDGNTTATVQLSDDRLAGDSLIDSYGSASFDNKNVGTGKTVSVTAISIAGTDAGNYNLANTTATTTANITARHLTVTATGVDKTYDGTTTATVTLSDDRLAGDTLTDSYSSASFSDKNVGSGKTVTVAGISISGRDAANYSANPNTTTTASISPRKLTVTAVGVAKAYDGTTVASVTLADDRVSGDVFTDADASATFSDKNVGTAKIVSVSGITISGMDAANYSPINTTATTTADITPRNLIVTANAASRPYDGTTSASVTLNDNRVPGDTLMATFAGATFSDRNAGVAKTVTVTGISISGTDAGNYVKGNTTASTTADITTRAIEVTGVSDSKTYDGTSASSKFPSITVGSLVGGDSATYSQTFDSKNAGPRFLIPSIVITDGNNGHNYSVIFHNANGTISPLTVAGSITVLDKTYDGTSAATISTRTLSGVLAGDVVSYAGGTATFSDSNAGVGKNVTAVGLFLAGSDAGNYTANSTATATATIAKANQQISWSTPAPIVLGMSLGSAQLNALVTAVQGGTAPGALIYTPAAGTILGVGNSQLRVDAASTINYNPATATVSINVFYSTGACLGDLGHSILQPINADGSSTFKQGSTIPAKFRVCDAAGHSIGNAGLVTSFNLVQTISGTVSTTVDEDVVSTTPDSNFRWDPSAQQWIFNVSTKPLSAHTTYVYLIGLNDGSTISFRYGLPR
jgi:hypothetical protein